MIHCSRSPDGPHAVRIRLIVVVLVARVAGIPVLVPRVGGAWPCTHTSGSRMLRRQTGLVAFSLACANGHDPDQMDARDRHDHHESANNADDLAQP